MPNTIDLRNALFYFSSIACALFLFVVAVGYIIIAISVNEGRTADLALVESSIQKSAEQLAKNPVATDIPLIQAALSDLNAQRISHQKTIEFGDSKFWSLTFRQCGLSFNSDCFHRNSSAMNIIFISIACGVLGVCLSFFISIRADAASPTPAMWNLGTLISLVCLMPVGVILGMLALFLLRGAKGTVLTQVSDLVQVESPFGIAFACTLAAFFSDRILAALGRLLEHFGLTKPAQAS